MDATLLNMSLLVFGMLVLTLGSGIWVGLSLFIVGMVGMVEGSPDGLPLFSVKLSDEDSESKKTIASRYSSGRAMRPIAERSRKEMKILSMKGARAERDHRQLDRGEWHDHMDDSSM